MNKIILFSLLVIVGMLGMSQLVYADSAVLSFTPAALNGSVGTSFNISVKLNPSDNRVCVAEGKINFGDLFCQNIALASGIVAQTTPTCASPSFVVGIPKCATTAENIISMSVKGTKAGKAILSLSGTKVIGAGMDITSTVEAGAYNITETAPTGEAVSNGTQQPIQEVTNPAQENSEGGGLTTSAAAASLATTGSKWFNYIFTILVILIIIYLGYFFFVKKNKKEEPTQPNK